MAHATMRHLAVVAASATGATAFAAAHVPARHMSAPAAGTRRMVEPGSGVTGDAGACGVDGFRTVPPHHPASLTRPATCRRQALLTTSVRHWLARGE